MKAWPTSVIGTIDHTNTPIPPPNSHGLNCYSSSSSSASSSSPTSSSSSASSSSMAAMSGFPDMSSLSLNNPSFFGSVPNSQNRGLPLMGNFMTQISKDQDEGCEFREKCGVSSMDLNAIASHSNKDESFGSENTKMGLGCSNLKDQNKVCARGHWRPAEDAKLKELVAIYGPQNWNLIAEKLEGRSGIYTTNHKNPPFPSPFLSLLVCFES